MKRIQNTGKIPTDASEKLTEDEMELVRRLQEDDLIGEALQLIENLNTEEDWRALKEKMAASKKRTVPIWKSSAKYAAIFLCLLAIAFIYRTTEKTGAANKISNEAIRLKIGNDEARIIDEGETQQLVSASGQVVGEQKGNRISHTSSSETDELVYNELEIPYGKIFDVELSDGTLVHLNSGTKMRYPIQFLKGRKREVFIDGEAYFKVKKDKKRPFIVNADAVSVEVLGTEFNISSYPEDEDIRTVLVEGSVTMGNSVTPSDTVTLRPGQKGAWNKAAHTTDTEQVEVDLYTGWIKGEMIFRNASFRDMAMKLERRYNVDIQNNNSRLRDKMLNARFNVNVESIEDVLNSIKELESFEHGIDGRSVVID